MADIGQVLEGPHPVFCQCGCCCEGLGGIGVKSYPNTLTANLVWPQYAMNAAWTLSNIWCFDPTLPGQPPCTARLQKCNYRRGLTVDPPYDFHDVCWDGTDGADPPATVTYCLGNMGFQCSCSFDPSSCFQVWPPICPPCRWIGDLLIYYESGLVFAESLKMNIFFPIEDEMNPNYPGIIDGFCDSRLWTCCPTFKQRFYFGQFRLDTTLEDLDDYIDDFTTLNGYGPPYIEITGDTECYEEAEMLARPRTRKTPIENGIQRRGCGGNQHMMTSRDERNFRFEICKKCPEYKDGKCKITNRRVAHTTFFASEFCPIHKWGMVIDSLQKRKS